MKGEGRGREGEGGRKRSLEHSEVRSQRTLVEPQEGPRIRGGRDDTKARTRARGRVPVGK